MKVLIDTTIWSLAFRRKTKSLSAQESKCLDELKELINEVRTCIIGPIRQEILSGISDVKNFEALKNGLSNFKDSIITTEDYELAAEYYNACRSKGIQGSHIDFLICAFSTNNRCSIFSLDKDFDNYKKYCDITSHNPRF